ncbi:STAS domain-containing protein [Cytobacillus spongiae]|uniref:STAS domain-containing protein n=1 Tax=Cytobacillus spongiae TaxID=2901381 RepID=UPI001F1BA3F2|nr:STAS domain-containing protein [Cytobacillus spongiae]UII55583.1 STAS domain-containing protein [Cytobacillus spongiae]
MPDLNQKLYHFLSEHSTEILNEWLNNRKVIPSSVYSADAPMETVEKIRKQNQELFLNICKVFIGEMDEFLAFINQWTLTISAERAVEETPIYEVVEQSKIVKGIYSKYIEKFVETCEENISMSQIFKWNRLSVYALDEVMEKFVFHYYKATRNQLNIQQKVIHQLSSPIIPISDEVAVLPLIGDMNEERAQWVIESCLQECSEKHITHLVIDLSGVHTMDTLVAHKLFQVIDALSIVGVQSILTGIRPEIAQTAVQLGIDFTGIPVEVNLAKGLAALGLKV